jgi:transposase
MRLYLTMKEQKRIEVMGEVLRGRLTMLEAAAILEVSERQAYRIKSDIQREGVKGAAHGNRGRRCAWRVSEAESARVLSLRREKYAGFNDTHFAEKLRETEGIRRSRETIRRILRGAGVASPRRRRAEKYRRRRTPSPRAGLMLQADGSPHDWLEGRGPRLCLVGVIDDADKRVPAARFQEAETTAAYFQVFEEAFREHGLCHSVYADRHSIFHTERELTLDEQLAGQRKPRTQLGRALHELGITLIAAGSPQAKGRVERLWGTLQDRLASELRLAGARTLTEAQAVLDRFLPEYNRRFAVKPADAVSAWRKLPAGIDLKRVLCWKEKRTVMRDHTLSFHGMTLQLPKSRQPLAGREVEVLRLRDQTIEVWRRGVKIAAFPRRNIPASAAKTPPVCPKPPPEAMLPVARNSNSARARRGSQGPAKPAPKGPGLDARAARARFKRRRATPAPEEHPDILTLQQT